MFLHVCVILFTGGSGPNRGGACSRGVSRPTPKGEVEGDQVQANPSPMATAAGSMHPTGIHSCV